jgi:hypothetical protein
MAGGGDRLNEKDENDRGKDGTKRKVGEEEYCYNNRQYREEGGRIVRKGDRGESERKGSI